MAAMDFKVFLARDEEYDGYVVVCPSLPGCYSQGHTVEEALANIREAIELCLKICKKAANRSPIPQMFWSVASSLLDDTKASRYFR